MGNSEQLSYTITIVDTHVCTFFDGVLEEMLERIFSVRHRKTLKTEHFTIEKLVYCVKKYEITEKISAVHK